MLHYPASTFVEAAIARWRRQGFDAEPEPYIYPADYNPLPAATSLNQVNATDQALVFACFYLTFTGRPVNNVGFYREAKVLIQISRDKAGPNGEPHPLQDGLTPIRNVAGISPRPFRFYAPFIVPPGGSWTTTVSNLDPTVDIVLRLAFHGAKLRLKARGRR
jgi:hypothetical protein